MSTSPAWNVQLWVTADQRARIERVAEHMGVDVASVIAEGVLRMVGATPGHSNTVRTGPRAPGVRVLRGPVWSTQCISCNAVLEYDAGSVHKAPGIAWRPDQPPFTEYWITCPCCGVRREVQPQDCIPDAAVDTPPVG